MSFVRSAERGFREFFRNLVRVQDRRKGARRDSMDAPPDQEQGLFIQLFAVTADCLQDQRCQLGQGK
jgi:hypothetical protein